MLNGGLPSILIVPIWDVYHVVLAQWPLTLQCFLCWVAYSGGNVFNGLMGYNWAIPTHCFNIPDLSKSSMAVFCLVVISNGLETVTLLGDWLANVSGIWNINTQDVFKWSPLRFNPGTYDVLLPYVSSSYSSITSTLPRWYLLLTVLVLNPQHCVHTCYIMFTSYKPFVSYLSSCFSCTQDYVFLIMRWSINQHLHKLIRCS